MPPMAATGNEVSAASVAEGGGGAGVVVATTCCLGGDVANGKVVVFTVFWLEVFTPTRSGLAQPLKQSWSCSPLMPVQGFEMSELPPGHLH